MGKETIINKLILAYQQLIAILSKQQTAQVPAIKPTDTSNAQRLVAAAKLCLGQSLWQGTGINYTVACAISVNAVHTKAFGFPIGGGASTAALYQALLTSPYFKQTDVYAPGCIIISPTGTGKDIAHYPNGHVGIVCNFGICANNSATGQWSETYADYAAWKHQFTDIEDYPIFLFQRI